MKRVLNHFKNNPVVLIIVLLGIIVCLLGKDGVIWVGIGCSLIASSICSFITSFYSNKKSEAEEIINDWGLLKIYNTKTEMNIDSNSDLDSAHEEIDIIAIGMKNFLAVKKDLLEKKLAKKVRIRIISCGKKDMVQQREKDESQSNRVTDSMAQEVDDLVRWVESVKKGNDIEIKFYYSYPGLSYMRIDNNVYVGPDLVRMPSQQSMAYKYSRFGLGGNYYTVYFDKIWNDELLCKNERDW